MNTRAVSRAKARRDAILVLAGEGWDRHLIATALGITERQVRSHISALVERGLEVETVRAANERLRDELEVA